MSLPFQIIPYAEKTEKWAEQTALTIYRYSRLNSESHERIKFCYSFYNGQVNQSDYDYLRKNGDYEYPALVRHIPLLKTMFDNLRSEEIKRPFKYRTFTVDQESIKRKQEAYKNGVLDYFREKQQVRVDEISNAQMQLASFQQQAQQAQEQGQQVDPVVVQKIAEQMEILNNKNFLNKQELEKIQQYYKVEYKDLLEILSDNGLKHMVRSTNMQFKFNQGFEDLIVSDKEEYWIKNRFNSEPDIELMDPSHFYHSNDDVDFIKDCQWGMYEKLSSFNMLVDSIPNIDPLKLEELQKRSGTWLDYNAASFHSYNSYRNDGYGFNNSATDGVMRGSQTKLSYIFWMSPRQVYFYTIINEVGLSEEKMSLDRSSIPTGTMNVETRYINELWESLICDGDIVLYSKKCDYQIYNSRWENQGLPFAGRNKWGRKIGNSKVWETKDLQIMYNLVHYHKELWLALGGVKGFIMDKSQIPDDMTPEEWMYQRKMGVAWIETVKKNKKVQTSFNQFSHYDDTVSASIQYLLKILEHYERLASQVTGVSQQRLGQIVSTDQVGTTDASIQQSNLTTEILFIEHEITKRHVLSMWLNAARIHWDKHGKIGQYIEDNLSQQLVNIPKGTMGNADYDVFVVDGSKESAQIQMLQGLVMQGRAQNTFDISASAKMMVIDNVREMEAMIDKYSDLALENAQNQQEQAQKSEQANTQMNAQVAQMAQQQAERMAMAQIEVEKSKLNFEINRLEQEMAFNREKLDKEIAVKTKDIDSEKQVELLYLDFEKKKSVYDSQINQMKIQLDSANTQMKILSDAKTKEKIKDSQNK